jgi:hypothetical protein
MKEVYEEFRYITPPRTTVSLSREALARLEIDEWWAQHKRNGSRSVIFVPPDRQPFVFVNGQRRPAGWNRHGEPHQTWAFNGEAWEIFRALKGNKWCVFDGELLNHQTAHIKDVHYLYDVLVWNGVRLTGTMYSERYSILWDLWPRIELTPGHWVINEHTWLARNYRQGLVDLFDSLKQSEDEGLVVRNPVGVYRNTKANDWMAKILRPKLKPSRK